MKDQVTSVEQSKRLIELEVPADGRGANSSAGGIATGCA